MTCDVETWAEVPLLVHVADQLKAKKRRSHNSKKYIRMKSDSFVRSFFRDTNFVVDYRHNRSGLKNEIGKSTQKVEVEGTQRNKTKSTAQQIKLDQIRIQQTKTDPIDSRE